MGEMEENGGGGEKWGKRGGKLGRNGEMAGIAHGVWVVEGCGGMWLGKTGQNRRKMRGKWDKNGTKYPFFTVPFPPFFQGLKIFPTVPFVNISSPHSPTEKWDFLPLPDIHCHGGWCGCLDNAPRFRAAG